MDNLRRSMVFTFGVGGCFFIVLAPLVGFLLFGRELEFRHTEGLLRVIYVELIGVGFLLTALLIKK